MTRTPAPAAPGGRSPAPDMARGLMLLAIALAHVPAFLTHWGTGPLDRAALFLGTLLFQEQARVMFVFLFGYGIGQLLRRETERGRDWPDLRSLLHRRGLVLVALGFLHSTLLVPLDIVAVYGTALLVAAPLARARTSTLAWVGGACLPPGVLIVSVGTAEMHRTGISPTITHLMGADPVAHVVGNFSWLWPLETLASVPSVLPAMALGVAASRMRILEDPARHRRLLARSAAVLAAVAAAGRLPHTLLATGAWQTDAPALLHTAAALHVLTGHAGGIAAAALVALLVRPAAGPWATAVMALGRRSLTFYLFQSVAFLALFYPFTLDLSGGTGLAAGMGAAVGIWAVSLALAEWMRRTDRRGPAEALLRRLADRPRRTRAGTR
ncbi:hypothetical protein SUDANB121_02091 [Nocardiopsis dassonvillei]|uniref:DUF418 domain-containing protein n=1 Tax=Nocardiopsis dassonvillei TaxID=2014 RepID=UPI003F55764D